MRLAADTKAMLPLHLLHNVYDRGFGTTALIGAVLLLLGTTIFLRSRFG